MERHRFLTLMRLVLVLVAACLGIDQGIRAQNPNGKTPPGQMRRTTQAQRKAARSRQAPQKKGVSKVFAGVNPATKTLRPACGGAEHDCHDERPPRSAGLFRCCELGQ